MPSFVFASVYSSDAAGAERIRSLDPRRGSAARWPASFPPLTPFLVKDVVPSPTVHLKLLLRFVFCKRRPTQTLLLPSPTKTSPLRKFFLFLPLRTTIPNSLLQPHCLRPLRARLLLNIVLPRRPLDKNCRRLVSVLALLPLDLLSLDPLLVLELHFLVPLVR